MVGATLVGGADICVMTPGKTVEVEVVADWTGEDGDRRSVLDGYVLVVCTRVGGLELLLRIVFVLDTELYDRGVVEDVAGLNLDVVTATLVEVRSGPELAMGVGVTRK